MPEDTLVLGGGFGGLATALRLRELVGPDHPITVVDREPRFHVGLRKLWVLVGSASLEEGERPRERLASRGVRFLRTGIRRIDPGRLEVETEAGSLHADRLVVALGASSRPDLVPGMAEHAIDLYDPASVQAGAERIAELEEGRIAVVIAGLPYRCPPAPYEAVLMLDDHLRQRGIRERVELTFVTLQPGLLPNAGPAGARWVGERMDRAGIRWTTGRKPERFEPGRVVFADEGRALDFDLAIVAPPHRPPRVVRESPLAGHGGWIEVDRSTLRTAFPGVYAIGDVTRIPLANETALPKAGIMAEQQGERVARAIAADLRCEAAPTGFDGRGRCFLETGGGKAAILEGDFYRSPAPAVRVLGESTENFETKRRFELDRLDRWLGAPGSQNEARTPT